MFSLPRRILAALAVVFWPLSPAGAAPVPRATPQEIAQWVRQLGDNSFAVREKASKKLWAAGEPAEAALEDALKSDDVEVVRRARDILDKFKWGIYPDTPADVVALVQAYQSTDGNGRAETLQKLLQAGPAGLQAVLKIARAEKDPNQRQMIVELVSVKLPAVFARVLEKNDSTLFESLLERGHEDESINNNHYAAYWLLRGKLDERIAHFRTLLDKKPRDKWAAETLAYLYRAKGDLAEARVAAEKAGRPDLVEGILYEQADWKSLAERSDLALAESRLEKLGFRTAFARLAGRQKEFEAALDDLRKEGENGQLDDQQRFLVVKALLLNDRPTDGLAVLGKTPDRKGVHFDILCARLQFREAFALAEQAPAEGRGAGLPDLEMARTLYFLGEKERAKALFARWADEIKDGVQSHTVVQLLHAEYRAGLRDEALEHCGKAFGTNLAAVVRPAGGSWEAPYLAELFPQQKETAAVWWSVLRAKFKDDPPVSVLKRLRDLIEGKTPAKQVKAWIEEAERAAPPPNPAGRGDDPARRRALAEAAATAGLNDLARSLLEGADTPENLTRSGDLFAAEKKWAEAAERYRLAWRRSESTVNARTALERHSDPLPLFLAGDALVKAGKKEEGEKLMEQAHWVLLGDALGRFAFIRVLAERGFTPAARRETDLLLRVSDPNSYYSGAALRRPALAAAHRKEYLKAADGFEQSMLRCLHSTTAFVQASAYASVPAQVHQMRASGLLAAGRFEEAQRQIDLALAAAPGYVEIPVSLVPELERRGHKKEADALYARCSAVYEKVCRDYPRCAWAHNSIAWMSACCRRNLDEALAHARKAVELAPDSAGYLDTLAEVHFQRGEKDQAVALQKRVVELDPKRPYFRKQLRRLEAGDPSAERPPEEDD